MHVHNVILTEFRLMLMKVSIGLKVCYICGQKMKS